MRAAKILSCDIQRSCPVGWTGCYFYSSISEKQGYSIHEYMGGIGKEGKAVGNYSPCKFKEKYSGLSGISQFSGFLLMSSISNLLIMALLCNKIFLWVNQRMITC